MSSANIAFCFFRIKFGETGDPYAFQICGVTMYGLSRPQDVADVLDGAPWTQDLDFSHFISEVMSKFGVSKDDIKKSKIHPQPGSPWYIEGNDINPKHMNVIHFVEDLYKQQFLDKINLDKLSSSFVELVKDTLQCKNLDFCTVDYNGCLYPIGATGIQREVSLFSLVAGTMVNATIQSLFGNYLHDAEPDIVNQVIEFNKHAWILFYGLPDAFGRMPVCEPRDRIRAALRHFVRLPEDQRDKQCFAFKQLLRWMDVMDMETESRVGLLFLFFFASIANEQNACFWLVSQILYDEEMLNLLHDEMAPAWKSGDLDIDYLTRHCPNLDATFQESLRQRTNAFGWRVVKEDTIIRGKTLRKGTPVVIAMRVLHSNDQVWGPTVDQFDPTRFAKKTATRQPFYKPFAGGATHCPGRILAKRETYAFIATLLHRFNITLAPPNEESGLKKQAFPAMELLRPATGVKGPKADSDLYIRLDEKMIDCIV